MSVAIRIDDAIKRYGDVTIIPGLSAEIEQGEFFTLLGPSGCGKTTLLRMIAGFNSIEGGSIYFNDLRINDVEPSKRNIGMVFQNYAIFPHLSVRKNVEFGLKNMHVPKKEIGPRAEEFMKLVQIDRWADQMPDNLSGGQQQRVALARALVTSPDVLLMDEPLSNLDAKLRIEMREVIREIQKDVGITTVYVTHDQEEAMAVSDRIAVMNEGVIQQLGSPRELYHRPKNIFVAGFIGRTNIVEGTVLPTDTGEAILDIAGLPLPLDSSKHALDFDVTTDVKVSIRPEQIHIAPKSEPGIPANVDHSMFLGETMQYGVTLPDGAHMESTQESELDDVFETGSDVSVEINTAKINIYSEDGSQNLTALRDAELLGARNDR